MALPPAIAVTEPVAFTVARVSAPQLHVPPVVASLSMLSDPAHAMAIPVMAAGIEFIVSVNML